MGSWGLRREFGRVFCEVDYRSHSKSTILISLALYLSVVRPSVLRKVTPSIDGMRLEVRDQVLLTRGRRRMYSAVSGRRFQIKRYVWVPRTSLNAAGFY